MLKVNSFYVIMVLSMSSILFACNKYQMADYFPNDDLEKINNKLARYVLPKDEKAEMEDRFLKSYYNYYQDQIEAFDFSVPALFLKESLYYYTIVKKEYPLPDSKYRFYFGNFKYTNDSIVYFNQIIVSKPYLLEECKNISVEVLKSYVTNEISRDTLVNKDFVEWPNKDFVYNDTINKWVMTSNSSWNFMKNLIEDK